MLTEDELNELLDIFEECLGCDFVRLSLRHDRETAEKIKQQLEKHGRWDQ